MDEWLVRLKGHQFDLKELLNLFASADQNVKEGEGGYYYLRSSDFDGAADSDVVSQRALELIELMNGATAFHAGASYHPVEFDGLSHIDESGHRRNFVFLPTLINERSGVLANLTVSTIGETVNASRPPSRAEFLVGLADRDGRIADALRFYERGDWVNLYKAWEVVCDAAGGHHAVVNNGWAARRDQSRFTGTAQSRDELGDEARHASEKYRAPKDPMTLDEARMFVKAVIQAWIETL